MEPELRPSPNLYEYWMLPVFLIVLGILAYVRVAYGKRLSRLYSSLIRIQILRQVMREELVFSHRASVLLFVNFVLVLSMLLYAILAYYHLDFFGATGFTSFGLLAAAIGGVYFVKLLITWVIRVVFRDPGLLREYLYIVFLMNKAAGILLLPLAVAMIYSGLGQFHLLMVGALVLIALLLTYRLIQGLLLSSSYTVSGVYIILYLCTLEIMPFFILAEALSRET